MEDSTKPIIITITPPLRRLPAASCTKLLDLCSFSLENFLSLFELPILSLQLAQARHATGA
jgi:hypothetical protein